jgi:dTDP-4-dehydrorhamnose 3,5-epimerase
MALPGVHLLSPTIYRVSRGAFFETWNQRAMADVGLPANWVQDNFSISKKNVLRGIHYQVIQPQGKIERVVYGAALDVARFILMWPARDSGMAVCENRKRIP